MNQATLPLYIRFGDIPESNISTVHRSDTIIRKEGGLSVWRATESNGRYYPMLPEHPNDNTIADYFKFLINNNEKVYLVTGSEMFIEGADREPLLIDPIIIKDISHYYGGFNRNDVLTLLKSTAEDFIKQYDITDDGKNLITDFIKKFSDNFVE